MNRDSIIDILQTEGILPLSKYGQNFLCDEKIIQDIVDLCEINREDMVLEVGPGLGSLTFPLSLKTDNLGCVEIDKGLAEHLKACISNVMKKLFGEYSDARKMVFMVEDEAIARIDCKPGSKQYGPLAILASLYGGYKYEFKVPSKAFIPQPRTTSAVISFTRAATSDYLTPEFVKFLNSCFSMRRKMLKKNLSGIASSDLVANTLNHIGLNENCRAEELAPGEFVRLFKVLCG